MSGLSGIGIERGSQGPHGVMKSGSNGPGGNAKRVGDLLEGHVQVVVEHDDRAMVDREPTESPLELIAIDDRSGAVGHGAMGIREERQVRRPPPLSAGLDVAGPNDEPVRPGLEPFRVAQGRQVPPDGEQRLLRRVFGEVRVAQDPLSDRVEAVADRSDEVTEGLLVPALGLDHDSGVHASPPTAPDHPALIRYGALNPDRDSKSLRESGQFWAAGRLNQILVSPPADSAPTRPPAASTS